MYFKYNLSGPNDLKLPIYYFLLFASLKGKIVFKVGELALDIACVTPLSSMGLLAYLDIY